MYNQIELKIIQIASFCPDQTSVNNFFLQIIK